MWLDLISEVLAGASAVLLWLPAWRLSRDLLAIKNLEPVASQHDWLARYAKKFSDAIDAINPMKTLKDRTVTSVDQPKTIPIESSMLGRLGGLAVAADVGSLY